MADNTNPQAVKFANEKGRAYADAMLSAILTAREFKAQYDANTLDNIYPADANNVADGSETDGRPRVTNNGIRALYTAATDILTWAAVGSPTREARLRSMAVNGTSRF
jgi:hypothetical protein